MNAKSRRWAIWIALSGILVAGLIYALWPRAVLVDLAVVDRGQLVVTADEEGQTRVRDVYVVSSPIAGRIRRIESDVGDTVVAGKTIVAQVEPIDPSFLDPRSEAEARATIRAAEAAKTLSEAKLREAQAELDFARADVERARRLIISNTISARGLEDAERTFKTRKAGLATLEAELRMRRSELARARAALVSPIETQSLHGSCRCVTIKAPVKGKILRLIRESEGVVKAGDALVEIGNPRNLEIVVDFLSTDAVKIKKDQKVIIEQWGGGTELAGRVRRVEPYGITKVSALGIEEQRVNVIIDFTDPPERWQRLAHGFRVEVRVVLWENDKVIRLPLTALFRERDTWHVFIEEDGRAQKRAVQLGQSNGLMGEITDGLTEGERVVLHPSDRVVEGVKIEARG